MSLAVKHVSFSYESNEVLHDVSFELKQGEVMSILGANGAGKSTLFRCLLSLLNSYAGDCLIDGISTKKMSPKQLAQKIAYIPQSHVPVFDMSVIECVVMGASASSSYFSVPNKTQMKRSEDVLKELGIECLKDRGMMSLSGGERQLVLIARAIVQNAKILVMDEPCSALDFGNQLKVMKLIRTLADQGYSILLSTHQPDQAYRISDKILALKRGKVLGFDTPDRMIESNLLSKLYETNVSVHSINNDVIRVCIGK